MSSPSVHLMMSHEGSSRGLAIDRNTNTGRTMPASTKTAHRSTTATSPSPCPSTFTFHPSIHAHTRHASATSITSVRSKYSATVDDAEEDTTRTKHDPVPILTRTSSCSSESGLESETDMGEDIGMEVEVETGSEAEEDAMRGGVRVKTEPEEDDLKIVRSGLASFAFGGSVPINKLDDLALPQSSSIRIGRYHAKPRPRPIKTLSSTSFTDLAHLPSASAQSGSNGRPYPPIFRHAGKVYVHSRKMDEMTARKAMSSGSGGSGGVVGSESFEAGQGGLSGGFGGVGPVRDVGGVRISHRRIVSADEMVGRYEICIEVNGGHAQSQRTIANAFGPAERSLPAIHFKRISASHGHPYRVSTAAPPAKGHSSNNNSSYRFPPAPPLTTLARRPLPILVNSTAIGQDRRLLLVGPAMAKHLKEGGSVRIRDVEGSIVGVLA